MLSVFGINSVGNIIKQFSALQKVLSTQHPIFGKEKKPTVYPGYLFSNFAFLKLNRKKIHCMFSDILIAQYERKGG
jgi:hypothetical protein